ncbi:MULTISPECIES: magnesium transporter CorA family protein [Novosphingobium]|jgi:magnesium transporter|uniref:magnesium transporter CorA family protein n=1 Tax=Novosphingobium TaxID=165696 RepID=UPI0022F24CA3|nr:magnesium transporter CorA family protein [Novosphingobium resinovorum]GLK44929.1 magnesium/cobalt transporter [Novosphingobium resinovorum]
MLRSFPSQPDGTKTLWLDLCSPDDAEKATIEKRYGVHIPDIDALREIETSSRLRMDGNVLYMSAPLITGAGTDRWRFSPTGFILTPDVLLTVRYTEIASFEAVAGTFTNPAQMTPVSVLATLLEDVVDRAADHLEHASEIVAGASQSLFFEETSRPGLNTETRKIREIMRNMGQASDRASRVRYTFLSIGRLVNFILDRCTPKLDQEMQDRLEAVRHDITSLDEFETSLEGRIQLLQDAASAFLNIEQNDVVKVLTVASVVGIPPVLVVGVYGMNFHVMPELNWPFGYPLALGLCVLSGVLPYVWFKKRGWI